jgi:hypothetical protein
MVGPYLTLPLASIAWVRLESLGQAGKTPAIPNRAAAAEVRLTRQIVRFNPFFGRLEKQIMTHRSTVLGAAPWVFVVGACTSAAPPKAPGTNPEDMSFQEHCAVAKQHHLKAVELERKAVVGPMARSKPVADETQRRELRYRAESEREVAKQHEEAANQVSSGSLSSPGWPRCVVEQSRQRGT